MSDVRSEPSAAALRVVAAVFPEGAPSPPRTRDSARHRVRHRARVFTRCGYRCVTCGCTEDLTLDHIVPRSKGGTNAHDNLQVLCFACNQAKADR